MLCIPYGFSIYIYCYYISATATFVIGITWLKMLWGEGEQNRSWELGVKLEREDWFQPVFNVHTPLSSPITPIFYVPFFDSIAKRNS